MRFQRHFKALMYVYIMSQEGDQQPHLGLLESTVSFPSIATLIPLLSSVTISGVTILVALLIILLLGVTRLVLFLCVHVSTIVTPPTA
jgi:hypothetical protein